MSPELQSDTKKALLSELQTYYGIVTDACNKVGVSRKTFYEWLKIDPDFKEAVDDIQETAIDFVESKLFQKINGVAMSGDEGHVYFQAPSDTAIIFYLKTKAKKRGYVERQEIEHSGQVGVTWIEQKTYQSPDGPLENKSL